MASSVCATRPTTAGCSTVSSCGRRAQLGAGATITRDPPGEGGVVAEAAGRRVDYTLPALARLALADLGKPIEELLT